MLPLFPVRITVAEPCAGAATRAVRRRRPSGLGGPSRTFVAECVETATPSSTILVGEEEKKGGGVGRLE